MPAIESTAVWSKSWLPATLSDERADPDLILWDRHQRMNTELLPTSRTAIRFVLVDQPEARGRRWLVCEAARRPHDVTPPRRGARPCGAAASRAPSPVPSRQAELRRDGMLDPGEVAR